MQTPKNLSNLSSAFDIWMIGSLCSSLSSLSQNWSISSSNDRCEEAVSSLGVATSGRARWEGSSTSTTSSRARNLSTKTSILRSRGLSALIAWTALSCLSSLINTLDLRTLLRFATLTKLRLGATCLLSAKTPEEQNHGQTDKTHHQKEMKC